MEGKSKNGESRVGDGHDTFHFIKRNQVPKGSKVTYARFCCDKRNTVGEDRLKYKADTSTEVASMEIMKIHINSARSTKVAKYTCANVENFCTNYRLRTPEYMHIYE